MKIRTLLVDDEPLARRNLMALLESEYDFEIVGQCADGQTAGEQLATLQPDLVFLDVQMPRMTGLDFLSTYVGGRNFGVVFVTAYHEFALKAFDVQAIDYLLKPFRSERFELMLTRVRKHFATRFPSRPNTSDTILVKSAGRLVFVPYRTLEFVKARANYVRLVAGANEYDVREKIGDLEKRLHSERFLRIHRSYIVNVACISELTPTGDGDYLLTLQSGRHLPVGPTYTPALRRYMQDLGLSFLQEFGPRRIKTFSSV